MKPLHGGPRLQRAVKIKHPSLKILALALLAWLAMLGPEAPQARAAEPVFEALNPWGEVDAPRLRAPAPRLATLDGKTVGLFINMKRASKPIMAEVRARLQERFPQARFSEFFHDENADIQHSIQRPRYEQWLRGVDAVVAAVGDCGSCTKFVVLNTIFAEDRGKPATVLVNEGFYEDARVNAGYRGMPTLRIVAEKIPPETSVRAQIARGVDEALPRIVADLTTPLTPDELAPKPLSEVVPRVAARGTAREIQRAFYEAGYTDGLPIVVPTQEAVDEMLRGTDLAPGTVVARLIPREARVTVEKIAINAVMAGALPTHLPVLIAAVKALANPSSGFGTASVSTASWAPFWVLNGPIRKDINLQDGVGALNPGDIANAAIGRAINFVIRNVGGVRKGVEDMGVYGNPMKYTMVMGEREEHSPWPPLASEQGIKEGTNALTLTFPTGYVWAMVRATDADGILRGIARSMYADGVVTLIVNPTQAATLADAGWTKDKIVDYLWSRRRGGEDVEGFRGTTSQAGAAQGGAAQGGGAQGGTMRRPGRLRYPGGVPFRPSDVSGVVEASTVDEQARNEIRIMVGGGTGALGVAIIRNGGGFATARTSHTIELPRDWAQLVAQYKSLYPKYRDNCGDGCGF